MNFLVLQNPGTISVSVDLWVRVGSRYESPGTNGISHFVEHLLLKGTARRKAEDISREVTAVGGSLNAYTQWEYTQLHISILPAHLSLALDILADIARNSLMTEEMVEKERKVVLEEISLAKIYPPSYVLNLVTRTLFAPNPLEMPISGTEETVKSIRRGALVQFYRAHYRPNNALLTVVGNVDPGHAQALIQEKFSSWPRVEERPSLPSPPLRQSHFKEVRGRKFLDQAIVVLTLQAMGLKDKDRPAFEIINTALGSGGSSRLYQEIREKKGLSYLVGSIYYPLSDTGLWGIYVGTDPKNIDLVKSIILREIERIQKEPFSPQELNDIKSYLQGRTLIRNESNASLAEFISQGLLTEQWEMPEDFLKRVQAVTADDVKHVAQAYLREDQRNLIILKPYPGLRLFRNFF
ncbi:MAG TPA: pitrilysin family protein [Thermodesulfobacteriota bacterium]|nr:pitrilysin family protein [Thermodesulfobacteriota bacterium]